MSASSAIPYTRLHAAQIRVVNIFPELHTRAPIEISIDVADLDDNPLYEALSYVWAPKDGTVDRLPTSESITVVHKHGTTCTAHIGANLAAAMHQLRLRTTPRSMWIDALCTCERPQK